MRNHLVTSKVTHSKILVLFLVALLFCINLKFVDSAEAITISDKDCLTHVHQTGLLLHLDAGSPCQTGSTSTWLDTSGNSQNLSLLNSPSYTSTNQKHYNFNGTNQYGTLPSGFSDFTNGISITFYAKWTNNTGSWDRIIDLAYSPSGSLYASGSDNILVSRSATGRNVTLEFYKGGLSQGSCVTNSGAAITANTWKHYALIVSPTGDKCKIYINNIEVTTATDPTYSDGMPNVVTRNSNFIAESNWTSDQLFNGSISDLAVYNLALTESQVANNYFAQTGLTLASSTTDTRGDCTQIINTLAGASSKRVGDECVVSFLSSNDWSVPSDVTNIQMLVVAGGGGGGFDVSGGGGAGGLLYFGAENPKTPNGGSLNISHGYFDISVGSGGAGATSLTTGGTGTAATGRGSNGADSVVILPNGAEKRAIGGGGGNSRNNTSTAQTGGSGGGGGYTNGNTPTNGGSGTGSGITLQGFAGGKLESGGGGGGGGGGAGESGSNWIDGNASAGSGGDGLTYEISGSSTAYGGGGGGGSWNAKGGPGGLGGGGAGGSKDNLTATCRTGCESLINSQTGQAGTNGTGGGGGGSGWAGSNAPAGNGGSGIVVIRYTIPPDISVVPSISGAVNFLQTLSGTTGTWLNSPTLYTYQWSRSATSSGSYTDILGESNSTYSLKSSDIDQFIQLTVTATNSGGYKKATSLSTVAVGKADLQFTLSVSGTGIVKYGDTASTSFTTDRDLGNGNVPNLTGTLVYETSTTTACSINSASGAVTMNRASGTCNIRVSLTNDTNFSDTSSALVSITPATADALILTADDKTRVFTGSPVVVDPTYSISGLIGSDTVTVTYVYAGVDNAGSGFSLNAITRTNAGTYSIVPSLSMANAESYTAPAIIVNGTLTIDRAARTLSPSSYSKTDLKFGETATVLSNASSPSSNSDGSFIYTAGSGCTINSSTGAITATSSSGTCSQTTTISRGTNYETATAESLIFNLSKADTLTVTTATPAALTFTGSPAVVSPAITVSGLVANETATATFNFSREPSANVSAYGPSITAPTNAGSYVITPSSLTLADPASIDNYVAVTYQTATLTINKASQLPFTNYSTLSGIFGSNFIVYKFGGSGDGEETFTVTNGTATGCALNGTVLTVTTAGSCLITATKLTSENYLQAESTFTVIIYVFVAAPTAPVSTTPTQIAIATSNAWSTSATAKPKISGISPSSGPVGTEVTITGTGFDGVDTVRIGLENLTNITGLTSTSVTGTIPAGASSGPIFVSNSLGGGVLFSGFTVTSGP